MNSITLILLLAACIVPVFISIMFVPYITRKTESFGVSIPEDIYYDPTLKAMRKQYAIVTGIIGLITIAVFFILSLGSENSNIASITFSFILLFYIAVSFIVYLIFHRKMKSLKAERKWSTQKPQHVLVDTKFRSHKLTHSNMWFILPFAITLGTLILTFSFYDRIPAKIPLQYNFSGEVTNWATKSYRTVIALPIMQMYLTLLFIFINTMISKAKQQLSIENVEKSMQQNVLFRRRWSAFIIITGIALSVMFSLMQLAYIFPINQQVLMVVPFVFAIGITIGSIWLSFRTGQGGSRIKTGVGKKGEMIDRDDDQYWKLGQFYFNPNDPALFLEKRFGVGWTINFGQPLAWIVFILIIGLAIGIPKLLGV